MLVIGVTGVGGGVGAGVLRSLKLGSLEARIVGFDMDPLACGLYAVDRGYVVPRSDDPAYGPALLEHCRREGLHVLIVGTDPELVPITAMAEGLAAMGCTVIAGSYELNRFLRNKLAYSQGLRAAGFPFARTAPLMELASLVAEVGYPLVVKPIAGSASRGVRIIFRAEEVADIPSPDQYLVQEYLLSQEWGLSREALTPDQIYRSSTLLQRDEISIQVLIGPEGEVMGTFASRNVLKDGVPVIIRPIERDTTGAVDAAVSMARHLAGMGLRGPCNFQCKLTQQGPLFFEINPRFTGITPVRTAMGFREVEACIRRLALQESLTEVQQVLQTNYGYVSSRYVTEQLLPVDAVAEMLSKGSSDSRGWSTSL